MKGLLIKDWYKLRANYLGLVLFLAAAAFMFRACFKVNSSCYVFYGGFLLGTLPAFMLEDEENGWRAGYARTLPLGKWQIVAEKYIVGLFACAVSVGMALCALLYTRAYGDVLDDGAYGLVLAQVAFCTMAGSAALLPFGYRFGANKALFALFAAAGMFASGLVLSNKRDGFLGAYAELRVRTDALSAPLLVLQTLAAAAVFYALSWCLSVLWYGKAEDKR